MSAAIPVAPSGDTAPERQHRAAWWTFVLLAAVLLPLMIWWSFDFGATWDEKSRHKNGELVWAFLRGLSERSSFIEEDGGNYGGLFDTICAALEQFVPLNRYVFRHIVNATFGWVGILYCGRLARRLFGTWSGVLAMVLLALSPRYFADSMNNPKDLPFAALTVASLYYISTVRPRWPYVSLSTGVKIALALGIALNIRAGALIYLGYFGLLVIGYTVAERTWQWRRLGDTAARLLIVSVAVLLIGTAAWPWAQASPFIRPFQALLGFANFPYGATMMFAGREIAASEVPWYYAPWWFLITTPPVVMLGIVLALASGRRDATAPKAAMLALALFPVVMVIVQRSTLYDGVRHLLFVYPLLVVLAVSGWRPWLSAGRPTWARVVAAGLLAAGVANVAAFNVRSHPNETVYFNAIVGGPKGAFAKYDMDYWGNCVLEAVAWTEETARLSNIVIPISGEPWPLIQLDAERFHQVYFTLPYRGQHALDIRLARGDIAGVTSLAARPDILYRVSTGDGATLCVVVPGPTFPQVQPRLVLPKPGARLSRGGATWR